MIEDIIKTTLESFDFSYCIVVNILTYIIINVVDELNKAKDVTCWTKRVILLVVILLVGFVYYICEVDIKRLLNSAILAPVFWSWVMKPICKYFNLDYNQLFN